MTNELTIEDRVDNGDGTISCVGYFRQIEADGITIDWGVRAHYIFPDTMTDNDIIIYLENNDFKQYYS
jgi:hypothetical protein